jgi:hypothetical protein
VTVRVWLEVIYLQHFPAYNIEVDNMSKPNLEEVEARGAE